MASSRRSTREFLLQSLYGRTQMADFDRERFYVAYFDGNNSIALDAAYLDMMEDLILQNERDLIDTISLLAPRFDLATIPAIHIIILMIALTEMLYWKGEPIPESVSANEAVELAKKFSDEQGKNFINGAIATFLKDREKVKLSTKSGEFNIFQ